MTERVYPELPNTANVFGHDLTPQRMRRDHMRQLARLIYIHGPLCFVKHEIAIPAEDFTSVGAPPWEVRS